MITALTGMITTTVIPFDETTKRSRGGTYRTIRARLVLLWHTTEAPIDAERKPRGNEAV